MTSNWIPVVALLITGIGGGSGVAAYLQVRTTRAKLVGEARKLNSEADNLAVDSLEDALRFYVDELKDCRSSRAEVRLQLEEANGVIYEQGKRISQQGDRILELEEHVAMLEERRGDWRRGRPPRDETP